MKGFFQLYFNFIIKTIKAIIVLGVLFSSHYSVAQIATYDFQNPGGQNGQQATNAVNAADPNIIASDMSKGSDLTFVDSTPYNGGFTAYNWATSGSIDVNDYYEFTVSPDCGYEMTLNTIVFDEMHNDANSGDYNWTVRSSLDNYTTDIQAPVNVTQVASTQTISTGNIVSLSAAFHNLTSAVTFRFYAYSVSPAGMEWGIDNVILTSGSLDLLTDLHTVNFENDGCGYETVNSSKDNADEYFQRFAAAGEGLTHDFVTPVIGTQGQYYWAVESNEDLSASTGLAGQVIFPPIASPIDVTSFDNLQVKILIAAPGDNGQYDTGDSLAVHYTFDGGATYTTIGAFYGNGNSPMYQDTDLDGAPNVSVPNELDENLTEFTFSIPKKGTNLNLRVIAFTTAGSEELAFDNIRVGGATDVTPPEITSIVRQTPSNTVTNATSVTYRVTFNEGVVNVGTGDFTLTGSASGTISTVTPISSTVYDVLITPISGDGDLDLDIDGAQDITDINSVPYAGTITSEEEYTIDNTDPSIPAALNLAAADDTGASNSDNITQTIAGLTIDGTGENGSTITLTSDVDGGLAGSALVAGGVWSFDITLSDNNTHSVTAIATDAAGNTSVASAPIAIVTDNTDPAIPTTLNLAAADDTGLNTDNITQTLSGLTIDGVGENGSTITLTSDMDGLLVGSAVVSGGTWSFDITLSDNNTHSVTAIATDVAGNTSVASAPITIVTDNTDPAIPTALNLAAADDTGPSSIDNITQNIAGLTIDGTGENGSVITLNSSVDGGLAGSATVSGGTWSFDVSLTANNTHNVTAIATDLAGNASVASTALVIVTDTTDPSIPAALNLAAADDTGTSNSDNITQTITGLTIDGTGENGSTVTLTSDVDGGLAGSALVAGGVWSFDITLSDNNTHSITAIATDDAGNTSVASAPITITTDNTIVAPTTLNLAAADDTGSSNSDNITQTLAALSIDGTGENGAVVTLTSSVDGALAGTATVAGGVWTHDITLTDNAAHNITAVQVDLAGNTSSASAILAITTDNTDPTVPAALNLAAADDTGPSSIDNITQNIAGLTIDGTGENGSVITLNSSVDGGLAGSATVSGGTWSFDIALTANNTHNVTAIATDLAGNASVASTALVIVTDTTDPSIPAALNLAAADDTGTSNSDNITQTITGLTIDGTGENGSTVTLTSDVDGGLAGSALVAGGVWSFDITLSDNNTHSITAIATDDAGNTSVASAPITITTDNTIVAPTTLNLAAADDTGSSNSDNITQTLAALSIDGTGENGAVVTLTSSVDGALAGTATVAGGVWTHDITLTDNAAHNITAVQVDLAGNTSSASAILAITTDNTDPTVPAALNLAGADDTGPSSIDNITQNIAGLTIDGTGENGSVITLNSSVDGGLAGSATVSGGTWSFDIALTANNTHNVTAIATDLAGNASAPSPALVIITDITNPGAFTTGTITTTGLSNVTNYWNSTNTNVQITVPIANDNSLNNGSSAGNIQIEANVNGLGFNTLGSPVNISLASLGASQTVVIPAATFEALNSGLIDEDLVTFRAIITDNAGNTTTGGNSANILTIDQTLPNISPNEISFLSSGQLTFTLNEQLNFGPGATTGFSTTDGILSTQNYSGVGTTNLVTLNGSGWSLSTQVNYSGAGNIVDLAGNPMAAFSNQPVILNIINMGAGDLAFTYYRADDPNEFGFVLLKDIPASTQIKFTNNGWNQSTTSFRGGEETLIWEADVNYHAGLEVIISSTTPSVGSVTGSTLTLSTDGDQIFAYQGSSATPTFIAGIHNNGGWDGSVDSDQKSSQPSQLITAPPSSFNISSESDNAAYERGVLTGTVAEILTDVNTSGNWDTDNNPNNITAPSGGLTEFVLPPSVDVLTPTNGATIAASTTTLQIDFNENMFKGLVFGGNVTITELGLGVVAVIPVGSGLISIVNDKVSINISGITLNDGATYEVDVDGFLFQNTDENHNVAIDGATEWSFDVDGVAPTVNSINRGSATPLNANFGTTATSVTYTVEFSEDVVPGTVTTADFTTTGTASGGTETVSNVTGSGDSYTVTVSSINKLGNLTIAFNALGAGAIDDLVGNTGVTPAGGNESFVIIKPEPSQQPTALNVDEGANNFTLDLNWTAGAGAQLADGYLILYKTTAGSFPADPTDLITQANTFDGTNGVVNSASTSISISGLNSGVQYDFKIYPYTNSGNQIDYKTDATILTGSGTTSTGTDTRLYSSSDAASMSSLTNSLGSSITNYNFYVYDDDGGFGADNDNAPTLINSLTFNLGTGNSIDWADAIEGVELNDNGVNVWNSDVNGGDIIIDNTQITFNNIPTGVGQLGYLADDAFKLFNLKIWLKSPITDATLRNEIDGKNFAFNVSNSSFSFAVGSSGLIPAQSLSSGPARNVVTVVATDLNWEIQPPATAGVQSPFTSSPVLEAVDANGNRDKDYTGAVTTVSNAGTIDMNNNPDASDLALSFVDGIYTFDNTASTGFNYQDAGDGTLTVTSGTLNPSPASDPVEVKYSDNTTIVRSTFFIEPSTISSLSGFLQVGEFTVKDDNPSGLTVDDKIPTLITQIVVTAESGTDAIVTDWSDIIEQAALATNGGGYPLLIVPNSNISSNSITFSGIPADALGDLGYFADDVSREVELWIDLKNTMTGTVSETIDNMKFIFHVTTTDVTANTNGSQIASGQDYLSDNSSNKIDVVATKLTLNNYITPTSIRYGAVLVPQPSVSARDANNNLDLNYGDTETATLTNTDGLTVGSGTDVISISNGVLSLTGFYYENGGPTNGNGTLTFKDDLTPSLTVTTSPITLTYSSSSDLVRNTNFNSNSGAGYDSNIDYTNYLESSNITGNANSIVLEGFTLRDGGAGNNDDDGASTIITSLTIDITNWENLDRIELYDAAGTSALSGTNEQSVTSNLVTFTGLDITAPNDDNIDFTIRASFKANTINDNSQISFAINNVVVSPTGSQLSAAALPSSSLSGDENKVVVNATELVFTTNMSDGSLDTDFATPAVVEAKDLNGNTDKDFNRPVSSFTNDQGLDMVNTPTDFTQSFVNGVLTFPSNFQFTNNGGVGITINLATTAGDGYSAENVTSSAFEISSAQSSRVTLDISGNRDTFEYLGFDSNDFSADTNYDELAKFFLEDEDNSVVPNDNSSTNLVGISFNIPNYQYLKRLAIKDGATIIDEQDVAGAVNGNFTFDLTGSPVAATDGQLDKPFSLIASYKSSVIDNTEINITVTSVTAGGGSKFASPDGGGAATSPGKNVLNVTATKYAFTQQPNGIEGVNVSLINTPIITAQDIHGNIDKDINESFSTTPGAPSYLSSGLTKITAPINIDIDALGTVSFVDGILSGEFIRYKSTGNGTLTVTDIATRGISMAVTNHVDVINTVVSPLNDNVANNIRSNVSPLNTGSSDVPIYGLQFNTNYFITGQPKLNQITINFRHQDLTAFDVRNVFDNFRVFRSNDGYVDISAPLSDDVLVTGLSIVENVNSITISGFNEVFDNDIANQNLFLVANVKLTAAIEITVPDYIETFIAKSDIIFSNGSSSLSGGVTELTGLKYTFSDEENPVISALNPLDGEPLTPNNNVNIATDFDITFNEPMSFTGLETITLRKTSAPGFSLVLGSPTISLDGLTFTFDPPSDLDENTNYYVQIGSSVFADKSGNLFAGINNSTSWNFRSSDATPPVFVTPSPLVVINKFDTGFELGARIDEEGEIHYIVVEDTEPTPGSASELFNDGAGYSGTIVDSGIIQISLANEYHYVVVTGLSSSTDYTIYAVAQDNANPVNKTTTFEQLDVTTNSNSGSSTTVVNNPSISICKGDYQRLTQPITIREGGIDDFDNGNNQSILFALPSGFEINTASGLTNVQTSGSDISNAQIEFVNSTIFRVKYDILNTTNDHAIIIINNLEIKAINSAASGSITRIGGTAIQDGNSESDAKPHAQLSVSPVPNANFSFQLDGLAISTVAFSDTTKLELVAEAALLVEGLNTFTGNAVVGEKFFVGAAGLGDHDVTLTHTTLQGCESEGSENISVFDNTSAVPGLLLKYCEGDNEIVPIGENDKAGFRLTGLNVNGTETTANPSALVQIGNNYTIDIDLAASTLNGNEGTVTLTLIADYVSKTDGTITLQFSLPVKISAPPQITFGLVNSGPINPNDFCEDGTSINLEGEYNDSFHPNVTNDFQFGSAVSGINDLIDFSIVNSIASISPQDIADLPGAGYGSYSVNWTLTDNDNGCSNTANSTFTINQKPTANFTYENTCFGEPTLFTNSSNFPLNDPLTYAWNFDDLASGAQSSSNLESPNHTFTTTGFFDVNLNIRSQLGCTNTLTESITVGGIPNVKFNYTGTNFGDNFSFTSLTPKPGTLPNDKISKYIWSYGDTQSDIINASTSNTSMHTYQDNGIGPLIDSVKLTVISSFNCQATLGKQIAVLDTINVFTSPRISKGFDNGSEGWTTLTNIGNSWSLSNDPGFNLPNNNNVWVTNPKQDYLSEEKSNLYSASLNLADVSRPLIQFDAYWELGDGDGAILEYSVDNLNIADSLKEWNIVGGFQSGDDWYNGSTLDYPQQTLSRNSWAGSNFNGQPKNVLDGIPLADRDNVIFRFTLLSDRSNPEVQGFAFDNFFIGERTRTVLLENFTNTSETTITKAESDYLKDFSTNDDEGTVLVKINYHTDFPGDDPLNAVNKVDPSARALFYDISTTPTAIIDGMITDPDGRPFSQWGETSFNLRSLILAQYKIDLNVTTSDGAINIEAIPTPQNNSVIGKNTIMLAAVLEKDVALGTVPSGEVSAEYVLRKLLPNAAGKVMNTTSASNGLPMPSVNFSWIPNNMIDPSDLAVVVIIQNEDTKEVYQSELWLDVPTPETVTAVEQANNNLFSLYPNPASDKLNILLSPNLGQNSTLKIYDNFGKIVYEHAISETTITLDTQDFASGMYHVQVTNDDEVIRKRLIISRSDR